MSKEQMRPASDETAPDPANTYERAHPENESGMGKIGTPKVRASNKPDSMEASVGHKQETTHQLNSEDVVDQRSGAAGDTKPAK